MGKVLHETAGREKGRRRDRNTNEGEADGAGGNRNHSGRGGKTDKEAKKEKLNGEVRCEEGCKVVERDKKHKNREGGMKIHKPREKEKGISERGNNNARMGRVLHERRKDRQEHT
jgi:hypothetical protein